MKDKDNQKKSYFSISKNCRMVKNYMHIPRVKAGKTLIAKVSHLIRLFNGSKRWEPVAIHMLKYFYHYSRSHHSNIKTENTSNT